MSQYFYVFGGSDSIINLEICVDFTGCKKCQADPGNVDLGVIWTLYLSETSSGGVDTNSPAMPIAHYFGFYSIVLFVVI